MKITININGIDTEIELTDEQIALVEAKNKLKKFEWNYNNNATRIEETCTSNRWNGNSKDHLEHGRYRTTSAIANQSLIRNQQANRLEALADQLGGLQKWEINVDVAHLVYADVWGVYHGSTWFIPGIVYMTKECATEICRMLNEGEFSLDGEL